MDIDVNTTDSRLKHIPAADLCGRVACQPGDRRVTSQQVYDNSGQAWICLGTVDQCGAGPGCQTLLSVIYYSTV